MYNMSLIFFFIQILHPILLCIVNLFCFPECAALPLALLLKAALLKTLMKLSLESCPLLLKIQTVFWSHLKIGRSLPLHWHNGSNRQKDLFNSSSFLFDDNKSELLCSLSIFIHQTKQERCGPDAE